MYRGGGKEGLTTVNVCGAQAILAYLTNEWVAIDVLELSVVRIQLGEVLLDNEDIGLVELFGKGTGRVIGGIILATIDIN